jgi:hypothetical protein
MRAWHAVLASLLGLVPAGLVAAAALNHRDLRPIYRVADLRRAVGRDPGSWLGRTVVVRGRMATYSTWSAPDSIVKATVLVDPGTAYDTTALSVVLGSEDPLLTFLRHVPLLGEQVPAPQALRWGAVATYRVQLRLAPAVSCSGMRVCYAALLLDAEPDAG